MHANPLPATPSQPGYRPLASLALCEATAASDFQSRMGTPRWASDGSDGSDGSDCARARAATLAERSAQRHLPFRR